MFRQAIIPFFWTVILGVLCGLPGNTFPDLSFWKFLQFDSAAHIFVFLIFTFLWSVAYKKQRNSEFLYRYGPAISLLTGILYGIVIEILQYYIFVRRSAEISDMISDSVGCIFGYFIFKLIYGPVLSETKGRQV
jgi:VanZ family protein